MHSEIMSIQVGLAEANAERARLAPQVGAPNKEDEKYLGPSLPDMKGYRQFLDKYQTLVVAGLAHVAYDVMAWWDEIAATRIKFSNISNVFSALADSGKFLSWDLKIAAGIVSKVEAGSSLDKRSVALQRQAARDGTLLKGRQLFAIIRQQFEIDEKGECLANVEGIMAVRCHIDDIVMLKYHWHDVLSTPDPKHRESHNSDSGEFVERVIYLSHEIKECEDVDQDTDPDK